MRDETRAYLEYRLVTSGYRGPVLFAPMAVRLLWRASRGIPRLINILAHKSLMVAYGRGDGLIRAHHVRAAIRDTEDALLPMSRWWWTALLLVALASALLLRGAL